MNDSSQPQLRLASCSSSELLLKLVPTAYPGHPERAFWWDRTYAAVNRTRAREYTADGCGLLRFDTPAARERAYSLLNARVKGLPHGAAMAFVDRVCADLGETRPTGRVLGWEAASRATRSRVGEREQRLRWLALAADKQVPRR